MPDEISQILKGLHGVTESMNSMQNEFVAMKTQHTQTATSVEKLTNKVDDLGKAVTRMEGKSKGLWNNVEKLEKTTSEQLKQFKLEQLPLILKASLTELQADTLQKAKTETTETMKTHESIFSHKAKGNPSSSEIKRLSIDPGKLTVPRWLFYTGIFFGVAVAGAGVVIVKFFF